MERVLDAHEPGADDRRDEEEREASPGPLAEDQARTDDRDDGLNLLQDDRRDEVVAVHERLGEQDRRERRGAGADHDRGDDVPPAEPDDGDERPREKRQREQDE